MVWRYQLVIRMPPRGEKAHECPTEADLTIMKTFFRALRISCESFSTVNRVYADLMLPAWLTLLGLTSSFLILTSWCEMQY